MRLVDAACSESAGAADESQAQPASESCLAAVRALGGAARISAENRQVVRLMMRILRETIPGLGKLSVRSLLELQTMARHSLPARAAWLLSKH